MLHLASCHFFCSVQLFQFLYPPDPRTFLKPSGAPCSLKNDVQTDLHCSLFYVKEVWKQTAKSWTHHLLLQVSLTPFLFTFDPKNIYKNKIRQSSTNTKAKLLTFFISRSYQDINFSQNIYKLGDERKEDFSFRILFGSHQICRT